MSEENQDVGVPAESGGEKPESGKEVGQEQAEISKDIRTLGMFCHLAGLAGYIFPFGNIIGPLILWQIKKEDHPFIDVQGKEAVNFQISVTIYTIASILLIFTCIGLFLLPVVGVFDLVFLIIAAVKANNGQSYRYPLTIRFIK